MTVTWWPFLIVAIVCQSADSLATTWSSKTARWPTGSAELSVVTPHYSCLACPLNNNGGGGGGGHAKTIEKHSERRRELELLIIDE